MTRELFADAVWKGLGRAILEVRRNPHTPFEDVIVDACVHCRQFDPQMENRRDWYLHELVEAAGISENVVPKLIEAHPSSQDWDRHQISYLLADFARAGSASARAALLAAASGGDDDAGQELAKVDLAGFEEYVQIFGHDGQNGWLPLVWDRAVEQYGPEEAKLAVNQAHEKASEGFWQALEAADRNRAKPKTGAPRITFGEFRDRVESGNFVGTVGFGLYVSAEDLKQVAEGLLLQTDPRKANKYARILKGKHFPGDLDRCIEIARSGSAIAGACSDALEKTADPLVRELGLHLLGASNREGDGVWLLIQNPEPGDVARVRERLSDVSTENGDATHSLVMALRHFIQESGFDRQIVVWAYENSPCSFCRSAFAEMIVKETEPERELLEEFACDAEQWTRELVDPADDNNQER